MNSERGRALLSKLQSAGMTDADAERVIRASDGEVAKEIVDPARQVGVPEYMRPGVCSTRNMWMGMFREAVQIEREEEMPR